MYGKSVWVPHGISFSPVPPSIKIWLKWKLQLTSLFTTFLWLQFCPYISHGPNLVKILNLVLCAFSALTRQIWCLLDLHAFTLWFLVCSQEQQRKRKYCTRTFSIILQDLFIVVRTCDMCSKDTTLAQQNNYFLLFKPRPHKLLLFFISPKNSQAVLMLFLSWHIEYPHPKFVFSRPHYTRVYLPKTNLQLYYQFTTLV